MLFVLSLALIKRAYTRRVWVTKLNPIKWTGRSRKERWFQSKDDLEENFIEGNFDHMIVFRHCGGALPFGNFVQQIILDDPKLVVAGLDLYSVGFGALALAMSDAGLSIPIKRRKCLPECRCKNSYKNGGTRTHEMFIPA